MKRLPTLGLVLTAAVGTAGLWTGPVAADTPNGTSNAYGHYKKVPTESGCNDIVGSSGSDYTASTGVVRLAFSLAAPSCTGTTYTFRVFNGSGTLATSAQQGNDIDSDLLAQATVPVAPAGSIVGVEMTTSVNGTVVDVAYDPVTLDASNDTNNNGIYDPAEVADGGSPAQSNFK